MSLKTKNVFLTGGAQGLGRSYIDALLAMGAKAFFVDINPTVGEKTEKEFQEKYGKDSVKFQAADCTDFKQFEEAFAAAIKFLGYVDLFVNNAAILNETKYQEMIFLNYTTLVKGTTMATEHMRKDKGGKGGRIINVSSDAGLETVLLGPVYAGTKHAVRAFTSCLAIAPDLPQQAIEYGILCPCPAATDMFLNLDDTKVRHLHTLRPEVKALITAPVECITKGFMKLVTLDEMNGAILFASQTEITFRRLDNVSVGEAWPAGETNKKLLFDRLYEEMLEQQKK